jgi:hypothetical protein
MSQELTFKFLRYSTEKIQTESLIRKWGVMSQLAILKNNFFKCLSGVLLCTTFRPLNLKASESISNNDKSGTVQVNEKVKKSIKEIILDFANANPEAVKYLKSEKNIDISDKSMVEKISARDFEKVINDFKTYTLNMKRKLNAIVENSPPVVDNGGTTSSSSKSDSTTSYDQIQNISQSQGTTIKDVKNNDVVEVNFNKQNLLQGNIYGLSCPVNSSQTVTINGQVFDFKTTEKILNYGYLIGNSTEDKENLSCSRFSNEMEGIFKVKCNAGSLSIDGNCKHSGCLAGKDATISWNVFSYKFKLDKNYSNQSIVKDPANTSVFDGGDDYISCQRFDPLLEGKMKLKCSSGSVIVDSISCAPKGNNCDINFGEKKVVCAQEIAKAPPTDENTERPTKGFGNKSPPTCPLLMTNTVWPYDISKHSNISGPYKLNTSIFVTNIECDGNVNFTDNDLILCTSTGWKSQNCQTNQTQIQCGDYYSGRKLSDYGYKGPYYSGRQIVFEPFSGWDCDVSSIICTATGSWVLNSCVNP